MLYQIAPQIGPQTEFLSTKASIAIYGGAAGGGKTYALLLEILRHYHNKDFGAVIFRRNTVQVRNEGGIWDQAVQLYSPLNPHFQQATLQITFTPGSRLKFAHLENELTVLSYQGSSIPMIGFDELTHFEESQFWYLMSRLRSTSGVPGYIRATTNPDCDSWVKQLISWYLDSDGYPIPHRSGIIRWFIRQNDSIIWGDSQEELLQKYGNHQIPKSFTFIPSKLQDNKILMMKDPAYLSNLMALSRVDRLRLMDGNWEIKPSSGSLFRREWFPIVDVVPSGWIQMVRYWDRAATKPNESNKDPDWTRGLKLYKYPDGTFCVVDIKSIRGTPLEVERLVKNTASHDSYVCPVVGEQDPGSAGVADAENFVRMLSGYDVRVRSNSKDKVTRAKPVSAQAEAGNIKVLRAPWNDEFFTELENFPEGSHDDMVDCISGAFNELAVGLSILDFV